MSNQVYRNGFKKFNYSFRSNDYYLAETTAITPQPDPFKISGWTRNENNIGTFVERIGSEFVILEDGIYSIEFTASIQTKDSVDFMLGVFLEHSATGPERISSNCNRHVPRGTETESGFGFLALSSHTTRFIAKNESISTFLRFTSTEAFSLLGKNAPNDNDVCTVRISKID
jgi:hypothetical protein